MSSVSNCQRTFFGNHRSSVIKHCPWERKDFIRRSCLNPMLRKWSEWAWDPAFLRSSRRCRCCCSGTRVWVTRNEVASFQPFCCLPPVLHSYSLLNRVLPQPITTSKGEMLSFQFLKQLIPVSLFQMFSHVQLFTTQWTAAHQASLSITNSQSLLKLMSIA